MDELRMIPCAEPAHRTNAKVSAQQRLAMLNHALKNIDGIIADDRELRRPGLSYTIDTLRSLRSNYPDAAMYLIIGSDAFQRLDTWHEWREILKLVNIIVARRPHNDGDKDSTVGELLASNFTADKNIMMNSRLGKIFSLGVTQLEISSSIVRKLLQEKKSAQFLLPETVLNMIEKNKYYLGCE